MPFDKKAPSDDIIHLNVGGTRFSTSRHTLLWNPHSFFSSLLNGRIQSLKDETGAIFIDRDPHLFSVILNYLRTRDLHLNSGIDVKAIRNEAEYYGLFSLVQKLAMCEDYYHGPCGDLLFHCYIDPPVRHTDGIEELESNVSEHSLESSVTFMGEQGSHKVSLIRCHHNWLAVAFSNFVCVYKHIDAIGWQVVWRSPSMLEGVTLLALNAKAFAPAAMELRNRLVAFATSEHLVHMWSMREEKTSAREIGRFTLRRNACNPNTSTVGSNSSSSSSGSSGSSTSSSSTATPPPVDDLLFVGCQLVALSRRPGRVGVWHGMTQQWQIQEVVPITSFDVAATEFLVLGCENGSIYYIDMQKFPLRMKDNDLLVTELYRDPKTDAVTALSVYVTPKTSMSGGNWIEIAYGTTSGCVRIIVQHPETVGQGPQLFQSFSVHRAAVERVMLSERHLVSVCGHGQHVRTWSTTRFRGMISTQPGSTPLASFHLMKVPGEAVGEENPRGNHPGPYGDRDDQLLFVQKVMPETEQLLIRLASNGKRVCVIRSVDRHSVTSFLVHECEGSSRMASRRYLFTGHANGAIQVWDLTTALDGVSKEMKGPAIASAVAPPSSSTAPTSCGGPTIQEMLRLLETCEIGPPSRADTPSMVSPSASSYWRSVVGHPPSALAAEDSRSVASGTGGFASNSQWSLTSTQERKRRAKDA